MKMKEKIEGGVHFCFVLCPPSEISFCMLCLFKQSNPSQLLLSNSQLSTCYHNVKVISRLSPSAVSFLETVITIVSFPSSLCLICLWYRVQVLLEGFCCRNNLLEILSLEGSPTTFLLRHEEAVIGKCHRCLEGCRITPLILRVTLRKY